MSEDDKSNWLKPIVDIARQITTPIAAIVGLGFLLTWFASALTASAMSDAWKGGLLLSIIVLLAALVTALIVMAIWFPKHLTFDKDAHIAIDVQLKDAGLVAKQLETLMRDLMSAGQYPEKLNELAGKIRASEETREEYTDPAPIIPKVSP